MGGGRVYRKILLKFVEISRSRSYRYNNEKVKGVEMDNLRDMIERNVILSRVKVQERRFAKELLEEISIAFNDQGRAGLVITIALNGQDEVSKYYDTKKLLSFIGLMETDKKILEEYVRFGEKIIRHCMKVMKEMEEE